MLQKLITVTSYFFKVTSPALVLSWWRPDEIAKVGDVLASMERSVSVTTQVCGEVQYVWQTKRNWTKTDHHTQIKTSASGGLAITPHPSPNIKQQLICLRDEAACACVGSHDLSFDMATWIILLLIQVCNEHGYVMDIWFTGTKVCWHLL